MQSTEDSVFMTFGNDWAYKHYLFPAFVLSENNEVEYALKVRVSAFDQRVEPTLQVWSDWGSCEGIRGGGCTSCDSVCGAGQVKSRRRACDCPLDFEDNPQICFDCEEELEQEEDCPFVQCKFSAWTDLGNCVYHSARVSTPNICYMYFVGFLFVNM